MTATQPTRNATLTDPVMFAAVRMFLPGLSDEEALDLTRRAFEQVEYRVGQRLAAGLTGEQLQEFEELIDLQHDEQCAEWLTRNVPGYPRVIAVERIAVIADVVRVVSADLTTVRGNNWFEEIVRPDLDSIRQIVADRDTDDPIPLRDEASVLVAVDSEGHVAVWSESDSGPRRRFLVQCEAVTPIDPERMSEVEQLQDAWNASSPIVFLRIHTDDHVVRAVAEGRIPLSAGMSVRQLAHHVDLAHGAIAEVMRLLKEITG